MEQHDERDIREDFPQIRPEVGASAGNSAGRSLLRKGFPTGWDLLAIVVVFLLSNLLMGMVVIMAFGGRLDGQVTFITYAGTFLITIAFALLLTRRRAGTLNRIMHFSWQGLNPALILWGLILMLAMNVVIEPLLDLFPEEWYEFIKDQITSGGWATITAVVMAPICEEILFRGIIQDSLTYKRGPWSGILITSAIFGAIHGIPQQVVAGFFLGIIIGYIYWKTRSLWSAIILHGINNALATFMNLFDSEGGLADRPLREIIGDPTRYWLLYAGCALLLVAALIRGIVVSRKARFEKEPQSGKLRRI